jgi:hypothetical protein
LWTVNSDVLGLKNTPWISGIYFFGRKPISSGPLIATQRRHWIDSRGAPRRDRACNSRYQAKEQCTRQQHHWIVWIGVSPLRNNFVQAQSKREAAKNSAAYTDKRGREDYPQDMTTPRTQRHANAKLICSLGYGIRHDAVESHGSEG